MSQTLPLPGVALQWKAVGPFNQAPTGTVSIRPHFPFGENAVDTGLVVFPANNIQRSSGSYFATPLIGTFDSLGRLVGPDGYPLVVPALDQVPNTWTYKPTFYEIQIDLAGMSAQRGIFVAFANTTFYVSGTPALSDYNASMSATTDNGQGGYDGTVYLGDTVVHPVLVTQIVDIGGFMAVINSIDLVTNSMSITTTDPQSAADNITFYWGQSSGTSLGVDLSQCVNWI